MSQKTKPKIASTNGPKKNYYKPHVDGFNTDSGSLAFGNPEDWMTSKTRRRMGKENKNLF